MMKTTELNTIRLGLLTKKHKELLQPFLAEVDITPEIFDDPDYECSLSKHVALLEIAAKKLSSPNLGLHLGMELISSDLGLLGQAIRSQESVADVLPWLEKYFVIHQQATSISFERYDGKLSISYQINDPSIINKRQDTELSAAATHGILNELACIKPILIRVDFEHEKPDSGSLEHQAYFDCNIYFNQPQNRLVYKDAIFDAKLETRNYVILQALESYIDKLHKLRSKTSDFVTQMDIVISKQLSHGGTNLVRVADELNMSSRTLQRRLSDFGIQFGDHVEGLRKSMAIHHISDNRLSLTEIALLLGYSEASSFSRAFRRWTNLTPGQYRKTVPSE